jgi:hypothetical protein
MLVAAATRHVGARCFAALFGMDFVFALQAPCPSLILHAMCVGHQQSMLLQKVMPVAHSNEPCAVGRVCWLERPTCQQALPVGLQAVPAGLQVLHLMYC